MNKKATLVFIWLVMGSSLCFAVPPECKESGAPKGCFEKAKVIEKTIVKLSEFKIVDKSGKVVLEMDKTGKTSYDGKVTGAIDAKGSVFDAGGKLIAELRNNSILVDYSGEPLVNVGADGALDNGSGVLIHWLKDGMLAQGENILDVKLLPSNSPARRAASIVFFLHFNIRDVTQVEVPATVKATMKAFSNKPTGACHIGDECYPGLTQQGCYKTASNVGGTADWREGQSCRK